MIYVCDTHAFLWRNTGEHRRLGRAAARIFARAERGHDEVRLSVVSLYEVALLVERGRLRSPLPWSEWLAHARRTPGLVLEPLLADDVEEARNLPALVDPFDRLIAGTARRLAVPLVTLDERIAGSGRVRVIWE